MPSSAPRLRASPDQSPRRSTGITLAIMAYQAGFAILRFDSRTWVGDLDLPVLSIIPTADQLIPAAHQRDTAARIPGAAVVEIEGARHEAVLTHTAEVAAAILDFVA